jgi:LysM repeat protein
MKVNRKATAILSLLASVTSVASADVAAAQELDPAPDPSEGGDGNGNGNRSANTGAGAGQPGVTPVPAPAPQGPQIFVPGYPAPGTNLEGHLPSSSRASTDATRSSDGFDLSPRPTGPISVRGSAGGSYVVSGQRAAVPDAHTVRRGDTLWDISGRYYQNPYWWPRLWAQNPQILNPHWIYPGDQLKLRDEASAAGAGASKGDLFMGRRRAVPPKTVFLRDVGWIDDKKEDTWGEVKASPDDQMLLSEGDDIYVEIAEGHEVAVGQELVIFRPLREVTGEDEKGDKTSKGQLVSIRGTARIDRYNAKTRMVKARIVESLDVIERGAKVGPVGRRFDVVPPVVSDKDLEARILASLYPLQMFGQNQVIFIDKGEEEGVKPGQRFFAIRRGDRWRQTLHGAGDMATLRARVEDDEPDEVDELPSGVDGAKLPDETYAEIRVLRVRDHTATALVTASSHEVDRGARLVSRKGF